MVEGTVVAAPTVTQVEVEEVVEDMGKLLYLHLFKESFSSL